ncbi:hypothetical protein VNI00_002118 [Paramarasmius palmivorus]|uniref:F-box domain-containing protein n=1 Tax=Paramarasmius palmivorus TaxID=297713 RepID=A0AAW0E2S9_9AGAR
MPPSQHGPRSVDIIQALRSNFLPPRLELSQMQALESAERLELEQLEETITSVQDTLKELENRRDTLRQASQLRKSWLAPIRRLPVEVLKEIFTHVCESGLQDDGKFKYFLDISSQAEDEYCDSCGSIDLCRHRESPIPGKITVATPILLSHVCAHWRSVTISTPSLWASLRLDVDCIDEEHADLVDLYLQRSAQYPLKIALVEGDDGGYDFGETGTEVLCSVVKELYRCREFHYDSDKYNMIRLIDKASQPKALPLLTSFSDRLGDVDPRYGRWLPDSFPKNLRNLTIRGEREYTPFLKTLPQLPNLVSLNLDNFSPWDDQRRLPPPPATPHPIHTRNLTITRVSILSSLDLLFSSVSLPFLSSLTIENSIYIEGTSNLGALRALIQRSGCSLKELTLHIGSYSSSDLISLLELQPGLVGLKLGVAVPLADLFSGVFCSQSSLLPCIQRLEVHGRVEPSYKRFTETVASALDMVELRERKGEFVPNISLTFDKGYDGKPKGHCLPADLAKRAKELTERGVECRIVFPLELRIGNWLKGNAENSNS